MARTDTLPHFLTDVADAIRTKGGTSETIQASSFDTAIANLPSGGGSTEDDVFFYDYDGTVVESYTKDEFLALTEMPANPTHTGLTSQGWNWILSQAKEYVEEYTKLDIGQMYITDDGKTRIYAHLTDGRLHPYMSFGINGTVTIDWGDNSSPTTVTGSSSATMQTINHEYSQAGDYVITMAVSTNGELGLFGHTSSSVSYLLWKNQNSSSYYIENRIYANTIQKIELGSNVKLRDYAFGYCCSLKSITIPSDIASFGKYCFYMCRSLNNIVFPTSVGSFGQATFRDSGIQHVEFSRSMSSFANDCFYGCRLLTSVTLPNSLTTISTSCFSGCSALQRIVIPADVTYMGNYAFNGDTSLSEIVLPKKITTLYDGCFQNCLSLHYVDIPDTVTKINYACFNGCANLLNVTIPSSVTTLGENIFYGCFALTELQLPSQITVVPKNLCASCYSLSKVTLSENTTFISESAFYNCYALSTISLPTTITGIAPYAFGYSDCLSSLIIPAGVTACENSTYSNMTALSNIYFLGDITSVAASAFSNCRGLGRIDFTKCTTVPTLANANAFQNTPSDCKIVVPDELYDDWIVATNWSSVSSKIAKKSVIDGA